MDWRHMIGAIILVFVGYWLAKKFPGLLSGVPGMGDAAA